MICKDCCANYGGAPGTVLCPLHEATAELLELAQETVAYLESAMWVKAEPDLEVTNDLWNKWKRAIDKAEGR